MISTIHETTNVSTRQKDRKTNMEIERPYAIFLYNTFMKGVNRADQYLSFYSVLWKNAKWFKKQKVVVCAL
jgi:hypothetical protein